MVARVATGLQAGYHYIKDTVKFNLALNKN